MALYELTDAQVEVIREALDKYAYAYRWSGTADKSDFAKDTLAALTPVQGPDEIVIRDCTFHGETRLLVNGTEYVVMRRPTTAKEE